jgi:hypothetical protein
LVRGQRQGDRLRGRDRARSSAGVAGPEVNGRKGAYTPPFLPPSEVNGMKVSIEDT